MPGVSQKSIGWTAENKERRIGHKHPKHCPPSPLSRRRLGRLVCGACVLGVAALAFGDSISSPTSTVTITHNQSDADQAFSEQAWSASGLGALGATVNFTAGRFQNASNASLKADCKMVLRVISFTIGSGWTATATTDTATSAHTTATVSARSSLIGNASLGLTVTFVNSDFSTLGAGNYSTTVTGTITAN